MSSRRVTRPLRPLLVVALAVACVDPDFPRTGVPTLDETGADGFVDVAAGAEHTCALAADSTAVCWGSNEFGQLGVAPGSTDCVRGDRLIPCERLPRTVSGGVKFTSIAAGAGHTCGLAADARVWCWGDNSNGQLGDPAVTWSAAPIPIASTVSYGDIAVGDRHSCAIRSDGVALCWGSNDRGQLGLGISGAGSASPALVQTNVRFASIDAGVRRTCGRAIDGAVWCWGSTWVRRGIDGSDVTQRQSQPARVQPAPAFQVVTVGGQTTCALDAIGVASCWEANSNGTIGDATRTGSTEPVPVRTEERFVAISAGGLHTCAIAVSGAAFCWGAGLSGQLGLPGNQIPTRCNTLPCLTSPRRIAGWRSFVRLSAGLGDHACGITVGSNVYCWGAGQMGQRGDGSVFSTWSPTRARAPGV